MYYFTMYYLCTIRAIYYFSYRSKNSKIVNAIRKKN